MHFNTLRKIKTFFSNPIKNKIHKVFVGNEKDLLKGKNTMIKYAN